MPIADYLGGTDGTQAEILGVSRRQVQRYKTDGLSREHAERIAELLKLHTVELWPEVLEHDLAAAEEHERRRREAKNAYRRRYYQQNRERELADRRRYYAENRERILARTAERYRQSKAS